jgi:hypothetical protein
LLNKLLKVANQPSAVIKQSFRYCEVRQAVHSGNSKLEIVLAFTKYAIDALPRLFPTSESLQGVRKIDMPTPSRPSMAGLRRRFDRTSRLIYRVTRISA